MYTIIIVYNFDFVVGIIPTKRIVEIIERLYLLHHEICLSILNTFLRLKSE